MKYIHTFVALAYKENNKLEECIKSVLNQKYKSNVVIATSTPNDYIEKTAKKYNLKVYVNPEQGKGIGCDFDFASNCVESELITIAHQDDVYDYDYSYEVVKAYEKYKDSSIIFTDYYEIRDENKVYSNKNLRIKRALLFPLRWRFLGKFKFFRRWVLRFGTAISCPAVTFVQANVPKEKFSREMKCNVDWYAWEKLSKLNERFIFINKKLMGHSVDKSTTTTQIIHEGIRTKEDLEMLEKFWPNKIAKFINKFYVKSEESNETK